MMPPIEKYQWMLKNVLITITEKNLIYYIMCLQVLPVPIPAAVDPGLAAMSGTHQETDQSAPPLATADPGETNMDVDEPNSPSTSHMEQTEQLSQPPLQTVSLREITLHSFEQRFCVSLRLRIAEYLYEGCNCT